MDLKTKFNLGDTIYYMKNNKIVTGEVKGIYIQIVDKEPAIIKYKVPSPSEYDLTLKYVLDENAFSSREELLYTL